MSTKQMRSVIASARRSHRNAVLAATEAVRAYGKQSERHRLRTGKSTCSTFLSLSRTLLDENLLRFGAD